jgi:uncharacterized membrane protein
MRRSAVVAIGLLGVAFVALQFGVAAFVSLETYHRGRLAAALSGTLTFVEGVAALLVTGGLLVVVVAELLVVALYFAFADRRSDAVMG